MLNTDIEEIKLALVRIILPMILMLIAMTIRLTGMEIKQ